MEDVNDVSLMKAVQTGDRASFGLLYDRHIKELYTFIYYKTHHKETAEDITSQVFMKALDKANTYSEAKGTVRGWLYKIARNAVIDHYRTAKPMQDIEDAWDVADTEDVDQNIDVKDKISAVKAYLSQLSADQCDVIIMRLWQEMSYEEIAATLQKSEASCKMSYSRGIKKLKDIMPLALFVSLFLS